MIDDDSKEISTNTYLTILKFILVMACLCGTIIRTQIKNELVNGYMAIVNIISFLVAVNLWMYDCYFKLRIHSKEIKDNILRKNRIQNIVMLLYVLIFIINFLLIWGIYNSYLVQSNDWAVLNDCLGIVSLGFALTTDFLSNFVVGVISFFE